MTVTDDTPLGNDESDASTDVTRVAATYDRIADHFAETRAHPWPEVVSFVETHGGASRSDDRGEETRQAGRAGQPGQPGQAGQPGQPGQAGQPEQPGQAGQPEQPGQTGSVDSPVSERSESAGRIGLDVGAGNGRHAELLAEVTDRVVAVDVSRALLQTARVRAEESGYADALAPVVGGAGALPAATDSVDVAVYVATLHHLPTRARRVASLSELGRVLAPDGRGLVSAWSTAHDRFDETEGFDTEIDWTLPGGETVPRFYHVYDPAEFRADLRESSLTVERATVSSGNCYAVVSDRRD